MLLLKQVVKKIFQWQARQVLKKYKPKIIAITGSVGKTLTRDFVYTLVSKKFFVRKNEKSFTNDLGIPLAILGCSNGRGSILDWFKNIFVGFWLIVLKNRYPEWLILEVDGDRPGDIEKISKWISPDILIITAIGQVPSHIESFNSNLELFLREKKFLINSLKESGVIFYNGDDSQVDILLEGVSNKKYSCGLKKESYAYGSDYSVFSGLEQSFSVPIGMFFDLFLGERKLEVKLMDTLGVGNEYAVLLSVALADFLGVPFEQISQFLNRLGVLPGHTRIISGIKNTTIIDDSYNSSPEAVKQSIEAVSKINHSGRKISVIGDMLELGRFSSEEHRKVANLLKNNFNFYFCVGLRAKKIGEELVSLGVDVGSIFYFKNSIESGIFLQEFMKPGDLILVKGSQEMRMERIVEEVMRHPEDKLKLLVRQGEEWVER